MVNLHRWLKKNSPHLVLVGSLAITGLSGCRSAQYTSVEVEPAPAAAPSTYPAPLMVPEAVPFSEGDTALTEPENGKDLFLNPPAPPLADSGNNSVTGESSKLPLPEIDKPDYVEPKELTEVKPAPKQKPSIAPKETVGTVADNNDPLDETNLFPEDNPKTVGESTETTNARVDSKGPDLKDAVTEKVVKDPFVETFESTVTNPEVPVPNPGKSTVNVKKPESVTAPKLDLELLEPVQKKVPEEAEKPAKGTTSLFPPPSVDLPEPKISPAKKPEFGRESEPGLTVGTDEQPGKLPVTTPKIVAKSPQKNPQSKDSDALPVITPAIVAKKPQAKPSPAQKLPNLDVKNSFEPKQTTSIDLPKPDQLASIAKPDGTLPKTDSLSSKPVTKPLVKPIAPKTPQKPKAPQDAVTVVAELWSPADNVVFDDSGNAFVSHGKHISVVSPDGTVEPWATMGSPRGHIILSDGSHLVADSGQRAIVKLNAQGEQVRKVATRSDGYFLRAPNDLVADSKGGVYFTDPGYARIRNPIGRIHYVAADGSVTVVAQTLAFPEGIALSADGSKLLVVESQTRQLIEFEILSPGEVGPKKVVAEFSSGSDDKVEGFANGLKVDSKTGRIFVTHGDGQRVEMFSPEGKSVRSFDVGASVNGIALKGTDSNRIFATGGARSGKMDAGQLFEIRIAD